MYDKPFIPLDYTFDGQRRRALQRVVQILSGIQYETGVGRNGTKDYKIVPCTPVANSRQAAYMVQNASQNVMQHLPQITIVNSQMKMAPELRQNPTHVEKDWVTERKVDFTTGKYTGEPGNRYEIERYMPVPYIMTYEASIWVTNELQKDQILEQILDRINPGWDVQLTDNQYDWAGRQLLNLTNIELSTRGFPLGGDDTTDSAKLTFELPLWYNLPAKITRQRIIETIITNMRLEDDPIEDQMGTVWDFGDWGLVKQSVTTPGNLKIAVSNGELILLGPNGDEYDENGSLWDWKTLISKYGELYPGRSTITINPNNDIEDHVNDLKGYIQYTDTPNVLKWQAYLTDLPSITITPINAIIDPVKSFPGHRLPYPEEGERYLLTDKVVPGGSISLLGPDTTVAWGDLVAEPNNIIEYKNNKWVVVFNDSDKVEYTINKNTGKLLRWFNKTWVNFPDNIYQPGYWGLRL